MSSIMNEIELYNTLISFKKLNGNDALAALLRKIGVKNPTEIDASKFPEIEMLCRAGTRDLGIVEGEDEATGASDALETAARKLLPMEVVINAAPSIQEGFSMAAKALHARRPK